MNSNFLHNLGLYALLLVLVAAVSVLPAGFSPRDFYKDELMVFDLINDQRSKNGLDELEWNEDLERLARKYSEQMADEGFFGHFDPKGNTVAERAKSMKITKWKKIGENLFSANGYRNYGSLAVKKWMASPGHRRNIVDPDFTQTGVGIAQSDDGTVYITQVFIRRR